nr:reverse transcriptase domain-containing protein [Tanacetum cinerariifolium]
MPPRVMTRSAGRPVAEPLGGGTGVRVGRCCSSYLMDQENGEHIRTLSWEVAVSISWNGFKFMMIEEFCPSHEMQKLETELWNHAMVGAGHATYTARFHKLERGVPRNVNPINARNPLVRACYECGSTDHVRSAYLDGIRDKDREKTVQTKLLLIM